MVVVAQLVRALDCDSRGRRFEPDHPPKKKKDKSNSICPFSFITIYKLELIRYT